MALQALTVPSGPSAKAVDPGSVLRSLAITEVSHGNWKVTVSIGSGYPLTGLDVKRIYRALVEAQRACLSNYLRVQRPILDAKAVAKAKADAEELEKLKTSKA